MQPDGCLDLINRFKNKANLLRSVLSAGFRIIVYSLPKLLSITFEFFFNGTEYYLN